MSYGIIFPYDIEVPQGATFDQTFVWQADDVAVDLSSVSAARMQLRSSYDASTALVDITMAGGGIVITAATGSVRLVIAASVTAGLSTGWGVYDVELTWADGTVQRFMEGRYEVTPEVTR